MEYRKVGRTGLKVSELCMGTMQFGWTADEALSHRILSAAYEQGINFIDTADVYSRWIEGNPGGVSEEIVGRWIKQSGVPREKLVVATKVRGTMGSGPNDQGLSRGHIMSAVEASLRRLQLDYIDLYQTHAPDVDTHIDETLGALDDLVRQGKVRYIGCSNYPAWRLVESLWTSDRDRLARYDCIQPHYSLVHRAEFERELAGVCQTYGIGVIPYSPLAGGFLTGKYQRGAAVPESARAAGVSRRYDNPASWQAHESASEVAAARDASLSQVALAWLLHQDVITSPIIGPRTLEQWEDNAGAIGLRLSADEMQQLNTNSAGL
jgi:aryl-alcohol dehydrogenase-like predicted oxidoreductase